MARFVAGVMVVVGTAVSVASAHPGHDDHGHDSVTSVGVSPLGGVTPTPFTVVALPDTQYYSETAAWTRHFTAQTQWTKDWRAPFNIAFATHLGDIVENGANGGNLIEWQRADAAIDILDTVLPNGAFPYGVCLGNHDFNVVSDKNSGSTIYDQFFGPARYTGRPWYHGFSSDRQNHAQLFTAGGRTFLHLTLEWRPDTATFQWAQSVINANPGIPTICSTHEHVNDANRSGTGFGRSSAGQSTWTSLIRINPQIFMFLNGHFASGVPNHNGEHAIVGINAQGTEVLEMLSDYQSWTEGGSGYMRLIRIDERNNLVSIRTYSPSLGLYQYDWNSQFRYAFDFPARFEQAVPAFTSRLIREGTNGYLGSIDAEINGSTPDAPNGAAAVITVAGVEGTPAGPTQALIKFDQLLGEGANQIAPDEDVLVAKLRVTITDSGSGFSMHPMLVDWNEASTWNSLVGGISADGVDAAASPVSVAGANVDDELLPITTIELDVTRSIRSYMNGAPNFGWALLPFPTRNNVDFVSTESGAFLSRPQLVLSVTSAPVAVTSFQEGVAGYLGTQDNEIRESAPTTFNGAGTSMFVDASDPTGSGLDRQALIRFDGIFGSGVGQVPADARVTSAMLLLTVTEEGSGFTIHRMRTPWAESSSWTSLNAGVASDDVEAFRWTEQFVGADADLGAVKPGVLYLDVTDSVQAWELGETNYGWLLKPRQAGDNGLRIASSESPNVAERPKLIVRYEAPAGDCPSDFNADGGVDGDDVIAFLAAWDGSLEAADFNADGGVDGDDVIEFFIRWDAGC